MKQRYVDGISYLLQHLKLKSWLSGVHFGSWALPTFLSVIGVFIVIAIVDYGKEGLRDNKVFSILYGILSFLARMAILGCLIIIVEKPAVTEVWAWVIFLLGFPLVFIGYDGNSYVGFIVGYMGIIMAVLIGYAVYVFFAWFFVGVWRILVALGKYFD